MHEGIPCSGPNCPCPCDNCILGTGSEIDDIETDEDGNEEFDCALFNVGTPHEHTKVHWDDVWGLVPGEAPIQGDTDA
jgi:hypothetical protein